MRTSSILILCCLLSWNHLFSQTAVLKGVILDENNQPVVNANISALDTGTQSDSSGFYLLELPAGIGIEVTVSHIGFKNVIFKTFLKPGETLEFHPVLKAQMEQIGQVTIRSRTDLSLTGIVNIDPETVRTLPGANAGVENLLKTLPGVSSNNELSTQYNVRGGNYDENLVYVNGIEVYRPFLVRSGQQEGLSFVNPDLVRNLHFSAGGFQAKYGDKLSSVLDIEYRRPTDFRASLDAGLLGVNAAAEGVSKSGKLSALGGIRYRNHSLLVQARETETNFEPLFADAQLNLIYSFSRKLELSFLGNAAINDYRYQPLTRQTNFGTLDEPLALLVHYNGREKDLYQTHFGAVKASYLASENYTAHFTASAYNSREQEYYDIVAQYRLGKVNMEIGGRDFGKVEFAEGVGAQLTHARNKLNALFINIEHTGELKVNADHFNYGIKYSHEDIRDRIREYEIVDSAGFSVRPPLPDFRNHQPYEPYDAPLVPFTSIRAFNETGIDRLQAFAQWSRRTTWNDHEIFFNAGIRSHSWSIASEEEHSKTQTVWSPRGQFAIKPLWKTDMVFRISGGIYQQPPFYRELRNFSGALNPEVEAQRALHLVAGHEYSFNMFQRPFKLTSEVYYKDLYNVNPYTLENVRIRYAANNNAEAYAYGMDLRLNGEFVPGTQSWFSFGYLKTEENIEDRGFIARPTDQRLKFGLLFQDYVPSIPDMRMYLNLVYNTGLPGGSPSYADPYLYQSRLPDYKRADLGLAYLLKNENSEKTFFKDSFFREISVGLEIFNIFDNQNSITNTFVRDVYSKTLYSVPNYLTPRVFNVKIGVKL
ncbi:Outer membrane receptor proteins, mostly Fe transport [Salinimicrobium sediminis]|uniref:Outer membrane receptor proteins, mostly Fe transport n=1 Tax=Salinimicrobium sediminis TaxID=1343891 RepID=A0A285X401_9FLAO|nr:carboxypeptidase regulatory-like domain-containing protein [Salinimicrobium sediminis]SOC80042.1 Outer membrane receptor proteins, mostly Fe transport [Salinimicrobium sediminis]